MKLSPVLALFLSMASRLGAACVRLGFVAIVFFAPAAYAQTIPEGFDPEAKTAQEEFFCGAEFDGKLNGLCNAFCTAMDCDSLDADASVNACLKMQTKIDPLLEAHNTANATNFQIRMADLLGGSDGFCGEPKVCDFPTIIGCYRQGKRCRAGVCEAAPEQ